MSTPISPSTAAPATVPHLEFLAAFQRLSRSGFQSSEFAAVTVALALLALAAWGGRLPAEWAAVLGATLPVAYTYFRSQVKTTQGDQLLDLADIVAANPRAALEQPAALVAQLEPRAATSTPAPPEAVGVVAPLLALLLICTGCAPLGADGKSHGLVVSGGVTFDGASASVSRRPDGKTLVGLQVDGDALRRELGR